MQVFHNDQPEHCHLDELPEHDCGCLDKGTGGQLASVAGVLLSELLREVKQRCVLQTNQSLEMLDGVANNGLFGGRLRLGAEVWALGLHRLREVARAGDLNDDLPHLEVAVGR